MKHLITITIFAGLLAGCSSSKEAEKPKPPAMNEGNSYEKTFRPSDYDMDPKIFLSELKREEERKNIPSEPTVTEPPVVTSGFRVQLLATTEIDEVNAAKAQLEDAYPGEWFYVVFDPPTYKLRAGNFLDRADAEAFAQQVEAIGYADAWVVPEKVYRNILPRPAQPPK